MLPRLEIVRRLRPIDLVAPTSTAVSERSPGSSTLLALPRPAPYAAVVAELGPQPDRVEVGYTSGRTRLSGWWHSETGAVGLDVVVGGGAASTHRSRRHGRSRGRPTALGLTLTGTHLTVLTREDDQWVTRGRVDLVGRVETRDPGWLADLRTGHRCEAGGVVGLSAGGFGQLGLRDLRLVSHADGRPWRADGALWLSATSAGPGFFGTAHTSIWRLEPDALELTHTGDLFFRRPQGPGVYGDHATHVVRDGDRWLVATSTWGDFEQPGGRRRPTPGTGVRVILAETEADVLYGEHVLGTRELGLPTAGFTSVGVWDPHLARIEGRWHVGFASARRFFEFHPALAAGPTLDDLTLRAAATDRRATEGTTLLRLDGEHGQEWVVLASDGRDGRRGQREGFPVFDLDLRQCGALDAPYPTNLPWPTLVRLEDRWLMVAFNGRPATGPLAGYGTHGDVVVLGSD